MIVPQSKLFILPTVSLALKEARAATSSDKQIAFPGPGNQDGEGAPLRGDHKGYGALPSEP